MLSSLWRLLKGMMAWRQSVEHGRVWKPFQLLAAGLGVTLVALVLHAWRPPWLVKQELLVYDILLRQTHQRNTTGQIVIVDIDEESLRAFGQWPWPRYRMAKLLDRIASASPRAVGLDMVFAEPDGYSISRWQGVLEIEEGLRVAVTGLPAALADFDTVLAKSLARGPFILGYKFHLDPAEGGQNPELTPFPVFVQHPAEALDLGEPFYQATGAAANLPVLEKAAGSSGFFNIVPDADGVIRRVPLLMKFKEHLYPTLSLAIWQRAEAGRGYPVQGVLRTDSNGSSFLNFGQKRIPVDPKCNLLIHYRGKSRCFDYLSAGALLQDLQAAEKLRGKFVLLGTSAAGLRDLRATPLDNAFNGVEVHATILDNCLRGDFLRRPENAWAWEALGILFAGLTSSLVLAHFRARSSGIYTAVGGMAVLGTCWWLMGRGIYIQPILAVALILAVFSTLTWLKSKMEERVLSQRTQELLQTQDLAIHSMAALGEARDPETGAHLRRTQRYVRVLALKLREDARYQTLITDEFIDALYKMAPLHDIGKIGIPDRILHKPETLDKEEYALMKSHTLVAARIFEEARIELGPNSFLTVGEEVCRGHHEKWDGTGYPSGLRGVEIPLAARIMALADVYDAMVSQRVYKESMDPRQAADLITSLSGSHFDPDVVKAFDKAKDEFYDIALSFRH